MTTITIKKLKIDLGELTVQDYGRPNSPRMPLEDFSDLGTITNVGYRYEPHTPQLNGPVFHFEVREDYYADKPRKLRVQPDYDRVDLSWLDDEGAALDVSQDVFDICHAIYGALTYTWDTQIMPAMLAAAAKAMVKADGYLR